MIKLGVNGSRGKGREYLWMVGKQFGFNFKNASFCKICQAFFGCKSQKYNSHWLKRKENVFPLITRECRGGGAVDPNKVPSPFSLLSLFSSPSPAPTTLVPLLPSLHVGFTFLTKTVHLHEEAAPEHPFRCMTQKTSNPLFQVSILKTTLGKDFDKSSCLPS